MYISQVTLQNFRNFQSLDLKLNQGLTILSGPNGAGKTNFLEGIYYGGSLKRFPETKFGQLLKRGENFFRVRLEIQNREQQEDLETLSELLDNKFQNQYKTGNQKVPRSKYSGKSAVISFLPQDIGILTRSPRTRRRYLDESLSGASFEYRHALTQYEKVLKQRNEFLKNLIGTSPRPEEETLWDEQLARFGSEITRHREKFLQFINDNLKTIAELSPVLRAIKVVYKVSGDSDQQEYFMKLKALKEKEKVVGTSLLGPHRDDFTAKIEEEEVSGFLSRGQLRSVTLGLKILERDFLEQSLDNAPVILLDDIFSEFDRDHQHRLVKFLESFEQVFFSTTHVEEVEDFLPRNTWQFFVNNGIISTDVQKDL